MDDDLGAGARDGRLDGLLEEARAAVSQSANSLRSVRERYREVYAERIDRWERLRDELTSADRRGGHVPPYPTDDESSPVAADTQPGADESSVGTLRRDESVAGREVGAERSALSRIELAIRSMENAWLFLGRGDDSLIADSAPSASSADGQMRIVEAQEAERSRLAREIHDGPAQALANAVFQVEIVERMLDRDEALARAELRHLREILRRELAETRAYLGQLRPPLLSELGLVGAVREAADRLAAVLGIPVTVEADTGLDRLDEAVQTVILRVIQEALQNVRKHSNANRVSVHVTVANGRWTAEVHDDGRGFDADATDVRGRHNFGLRFMRERAELIGARFEVRSQPEGGTVVRLSIPAGTEETR